MTRKGSSPMGLELYLPILLAFVMLPLLTQAAPLQDYNEIQQYTEGCYYNYNHYNEGDRIMTNEPCLNCTCHNKMLMCYLRVCPFTKPIGNDCIVEKREDQCCPIITCPEVPVDVAHTAPEPGTGLSFPEKFGCSIEGKFYLEGAQVPSNPNKPCELCYCIKNRTSCLMQECTLHIDGCTPIYNRGSCCPVRYNCDHENEILELEDHSSTTEATTTTTTERPSTGFIITSTMTPAVSTVCVHNNEIYADGARIPGESACENCYCMRGDIVCAVQECHMPVLKDNGKLCHPLPATEGECCPSNYACEDDTSTTQILEATTLPYRVLDEDVKISPLDHSKDLYSSIPEEDLQLQIHINEEEIATKIPQTENVMGGRDPQAETDTKQVVAENEEKQDLEDEATTEYEPTTISAKDIKFVENTNPISSVTSSDNLPVTSTEIPGTTNYEHTEPNKKTDDDYSVQGGEEFVTKVSSAAEDLLEISTNTSRNGEEYTTVASVKGKPEFQESITDAPATDVESETSTELPIFGEEQTEGTTESAEEMKPIADMEYTTQVPSVNELVDDSNEMATKKPSASKNEYHIVEAATKLPEMELTSTIQILSIEQQNTLTTEANLKPFREQEGLEQKYGDLPTQYPSINVAEEAITNKVEEQESETEEENIDNTTQAPGKGLIEEEDLSVIEPIGDNEDLEGYEKERQDFATTVPNFSNEYERTTLSFDKQTSLYSAEATTEPDEDETSTKLPVSIHEEKPFIATAKAEEQTESSTDRVSTIPSNIDSISSENKTVDNSEQTDDKHDIYATTMSTDKSTDGATLPTSGIKHTSDDGSSSGDDTFSHISTVGHIIDDVTSTYEENSEDSVTAQSVSPAREKIEEQHISQGLSEESAESEEDNKLMDLTTAKPSVSITPTIDTSEKDQKVAGTSAEVDDVEDKVDTTTIVISLDEKLLTEASMDNQDKLYGEAEISTTLGISSESDNKKEESTKFEDATSQKPIQEQDQEISTSPTIDDNPDEIQKVLAEEESTITDSPMLIIEDISAYTTTKPSAQEDIRLQSNAKSEEKQIGDSAASQEPSLDIKGVSEEQVKTSTVKSFVEPTAAAEMPHEMLPVTIPGEGDCLSDQKTYKNNSIVPISDECEIACKCVSSIIVCERVKCDIPENIEKCTLDKVSVSKCCPTYHCSIDSASEDSVESIEEDATPSKIVTQQNSEESGMNKYNTTTIKPIYDGISIPEIEMPVAITEEPMSHVKAEEEVDQQTISSPIKTIPEEKKDMVTEDHSSSTPADAIEQGIVTQATTPNETSKQKEHETVTEKVPDKTLEKGGTPEVPITEEGPGKKFEDQSIPSYNPDESATDTLKPLESGTQSSISTSLEDSTYKNLGQTSSLTHPTEVEEIKDGYHVPESQTIQPILSDELSTTIPGYEIRMSTVSTEYNDKNTSDYNKETFDATNTAALSKDSSAESEINDTTAVPLTDNLESKSSTQSEFVDTSPDSTTAAPVAEETYDLPFEKEDHKTKDDKDLVRTTDTITSEQEIEASTIRIEHVTTSGDEILEDTVSLIIDSAEEQTSEESVTPSPETFQINQSDSKINILPIGDSNIIPTPEEVDQENKEEFYTTSATIYNENTSTHSTTSISESISVSPSDVKELEEEKIIKDFASVTDITTGQPSMDVEMEHSKLPTKKPALDLFENVSEESMESEEEISSAPTTISHLDEFITQQMKENEEEEGSGGEGEGSGEEGEGSGEEGEESDEKGKGSGKEGEGSGKEIDKIEAPTDKPLMLEGVAETTGKYEYNDLPNDKIFGEDSSRIPTAVTAMLPEDISIYELEKEDEELNQSSEQPKENKVTTTQYEKSENVTEHSTVKPYLPFDETEQTASKYPTDSKEPATATDKRLENEESIVSATQSSVPYADTDSTTIQSLTKSDEPKEIETSTANLDINKVPQVPTDELKPNQGEVLEEEIDSSSAKHSQLEFGTNIPPFETVSMIASTTSKHSADNVDVTTEPETLKMDDATVKSEVLADDLVITQVPTTIKDQNIGVDGTTDHSTKVVSQYFTEQPLSERQSENKYKEFSTELPVIEEAPDTEILLNAEQSEKNVSDEITTKVDSDANTSTDKLPAKDIKLDEETTELPVDSHVPTQHSPSVSTEIEIVRLPESSTDLPMDSDLLYKKLPDQSTVLPRVEVSSVKSLEQDSLMEQSTSLPIDTAAEMDGKISPVESLRPDSELPTKTIHPEDEEFMEQSTSLPIDTATELVDEVYTAKSLEQEYELPTKTINPEDEKLIEHITSVPIDTATELDSEVSTFESLGQDSELPTETIHPEDEKFMEQSTSVPIDAATGLVAEMSTVKSLEQDSEPPTKIINPEDEKLIEPITSVPIDTATELDGEVSPIASLGQDSELPTKTINPVDEKLIEPTTSVPLDTDAKLDGEVSPIESLGQDSEMPTKTINPEDEKLIEPITSVPIDTATELDGEVSPIESLGKDSELPTETIHPEDEKFMEQSTSLPIETATELDGEVSPVKSMEQDSELPTKKINPEDETLMEHITSMPIDTAAESDGEVSPIESLGKDSELPTKTIHPEDDKLMEQHTNLPIETATELDGEVSPVETLEQDSELPTKTMHNEDEKFIEHSTSAPIGTATELDGEVSPVESLGQDSELPTKTINPEDEKFMEQSTNLPVETATELDVEVSPVESLGQDSELPTETIHPEDEKFMEQSTNVPTDAATGLVAEMSTVKSLEQDSEPPTKTINPEDEKLVEPITSVPIDTATELDGEVSPIESLGKDSKLPTETIHPEEEKLIDHITTVPTDAATELDDEVSPVESLGQDSELPTKTINPEDEKLIAPITNVPIDTATELDGEVSPIESLGKDSELPTETIHPEDEKFMEQSTNLPIDTATELDSEVSPVETLEQDSELSTKTIHDEDEKSIEHSTSAPIGTATELDGEVSPVESLGQDSELPTKTINPEDEKFMEQSTNLPVETATELDVEVSSVNLQKDLEQPIRPMYSEGALQLEQSTILPLNEHVTELPTKDSISEEEIYEQPTELPVSADISRDNLQSLDEKQMEQSSDIHKDGHTSSDKLPSNITELPAKNIESEEVYESSTKLPERVTESPYKNIESEEGLYEESTGKLPESSSNNIKTTELPIVDHHPPTSGETIEQVTDQPAHIEGSHEGISTAGPVDINEVKLHSATTQHPLFSHHITLPSLPTVSRNDNTVPHSTSVPEKNEIFTTTTTTTVSKTTSEPIATSAPHYQPQPPIYGQPPQYGPTQYEDEYTDEEEGEVFGPGTCRYGGKLYVSAQQIPRDDPCDFCFCFRSDIICLQQSCPPPIAGCHEEPISGFCCPRYECPVSMATVLNITTSTTTTSTTLPPHFLHHAYGHNIQRNGCLINGRSYRIGEKIESTSGPCINCTCGGDGKMKCDPQACVPEPTMQQVMAVVAAGRKR